MTAARNVSEADVAAQGLVKIRFELDGTDWHGRASETLWARPIDAGACQLFELRNSPFFVRGFSWRDHVQGTPTDLPGVHACVGLAARSGHSTYMVLVPIASPLTERSWHPLERLGCTFESMAIRLSIGMQTLYSVDVPNRDFAQGVEDILTRGEGRGEWIFQIGHRACQAHTHTCRE